MRCNASPISHPGKGPGGRFLAKGLDMQKLLLTVDKLSTFVGKIFSWLIVSLTLLITWEMFSRYALDKPHDWAFDLMLRCMDRSS